MAKSPRRPIELAVTVKLNVDLKTCDEWLADNLLWGHGGASPNGLLKRKYLEPGSDLERVARHALARVLRSDEPLSKTLRKRLAELFDPDSTAAERWLKFQFRHKGNRSNVLADRQVARYVERKIGQGHKVEAAVQAAMELYGLTRKAIFDVRKKCKQGKKVTSIREKR